MTWYRDREYWVDPDADVATTVSSTTYDGYGRPLAVTDAAGNVTSMRYNALGQLVQVIAPARLVAPLAAVGRPWLFALYADLLGREPDADGLAGWMGQLEAGQSPESVANGFLKSQEYCTRIITGLYEKLLDRAPDPAGLAGWVSTMEGGTAL